MSNFWGGSESKLILEVERRLQMSLCHMVYEGVLRTQSPDLLCSGYALAGSCNGNRAMTPTQVLCSEMWVSQAVSELLSLMLTLCHLFIQFLKR